MHECDYLRACQLYQLEFQKIRGIVSVGELEFKNMMLLIQFAVIFLEFNNFRQNAGGFVVLEFELSTKVKRYAYI